MARFLASRVLQGVVIVLLVATLTFILMQFVPGDPVDALGSERRLAPDIAERMRTKFGLDQPIIIRYARYLSNIASGDFGYSFSEPTPAWEAVRSRIPATLLLALTALLIDFTLGVTIGVAQGMRADSRADHILSMLTLTAFSVPVFWLGFGLVLVFAENLRWFPSSGYTTPLSYRLSLFDLTLDRLHHLALPSLTLGVVGAAATARFQRAAMVDAMNQSFVRTARAKGVEHRRVVHVHALRNALLPVITLFGLSFPILLSGAVLVETVFDWPGMGALAVDSFERRDYPVITALAVVSAIMVVLGNMLADILYRVVDPRTRALT